MSQADASAAPGARPKPPFRADHVGSFLRPARLLEARDQFQKGAITAAALRAVEDDAIRGVVKFQEDLGLRGITDGEFRRTYFHIDFLTKLSGVTTKGGINVSFHSAAGNVDFAPPVMQVTDKVRHDQPIQRADFEFLRSVTKGTAKVTIPSPTMLHFRGGRGAISRDAYPDLESFYDDVAQAYRDELADLAKAGCTYVQLDDTNLAYLCDEKMREGARSRGDDPNELPRRYAKLINAAIATRPASMTACVHLCRGNFKSAWAAEGGYEPVAEVLFNDLEVDGYFLEYDDARSGDFAPLRHRAEGQDRGAGSRQHQGRPARVQGRLEAPHRCRREARSDGAALPVAAVRFLEHGARQRDRDGIAGGQAAARGRDRARRMGRSLRETH